MDSLQFRRQSLSAPPPELHRLSSAGGVSNGSASRHNPLSVSSLLNDSTRTSRRTSSSTASSQESKFSSTLQVPPLDNGRYGSMSHSQASGPSHHFDDPRNAPTGRLDERRFETTTHLDHRNTVRDPCSFRAVPHPLNRSLSESSPSHPLAGDAMSRFSGLDRSFDSPSSVHRHHEPHPYPLPSMSHSYHHGVPSRSPSPGSRPANPERHRLRTLHTSYGEMASVGMIPRNPLESRRTPVGYADPEGELDYFRRISVPFPVDSSHSEGPDDCRRIRFFSHQEHVPPRAMSSPREDYFRGAVPASTMLPADRSHPSPGRSTHSPRSPHYRSMASPSTVSLQSPPLAASGDAEQPSTRRSSSSETSSFSDSENTRAKSNGSATGIASLPPSGSSRAPISRTTKACNACRQRKVRCDAGATTGEMKPNGEPGTCSRCKETGLECIYTTEQRKRGPVPGSTRNTTGNTIKRKNSSQRLISGAGPKLQHRPSFNNIREAASEDHFQPNTTSGVASHSAYYARPSPYMNSFSQHRGRPELASLKLSADDHPALRRQSSYSQLNSPSSGPGAMRNRNVSIATAAASLSLNSSVPEVVVETRTTSSMHSPYDSLPGYDSSMMYAPPMIKHPSDAPHSAPAMHTSHARPEHLAGPGGEHPHHSHHMQRTYSSNPYFFDARGHSFDNGPAAVTSSPRMRAGSGDTLSRSASVQHQQGSSSSAGSIVLPPIRILVD